MSQASEKNTNGINNLITTFMEVYKDPNRTNYLTNLGEIFPIDKNFHIVHYIITRKKNSIVIMTDPKT